MASTFTSLCLGLVLGAVAAFLSLRTADRRPPGHGASPVARPVVLPAWNWRDSAAPALLPRDEAAAAVIAWLGLRDASGGVPIFSIRASTLRALVLQLPSEGFQRLLDNLAVSKKDDDQALMRIAFSAWIRRDAPAAARWAVGRMPPTARADTFSALAMEALRAWSAGDPEAAATWSCSVPDSELAQRIAAQPLAALAEKSPERALALLQSRDEKLRSALLRLVLAPLARKDPAGTIRTFAPEVWKNGEGFYILQGAISEWFKQDGRTALAWLFAQPVEHASLIPYWMTNLAGNTEESRRALANALAAQEGGVDRAKLLGTLLFNWSSNNPDEVLAWLNELPDQELRIDILGHQNSFLTDSPQKSLPLALAMPEGADRNDRLSTLLGAWAKIDPDATLAWMNEHADEPGLDRASLAVHQALFAELAREDPQAAIAELTTVSDPKVRSGAIIAIANEWSRTDPAAAIRWTEEEFTKMGSSPPGGHEYQQIITRWAQTDPEAALRWIEEQASREPENTRWRINQLVSALGGDWATKLPRADTAALFLKIRDPKLRITALTNHLNEWSSKDPVAARAWLANAPGLTGEERQRLLPAKR